MPYEYRRMTPEQREAIRRLRTAKGYPLHSPPHPINEKTYYLLTAVNFEHRHIIASDERRSSFQKAVLEKFCEAASEVSAWVFLKNHYHLLAFVPNFPKLSFIFNGLHGATSRQWNLEDGLTGKRKIWYKFNDRMIRGEAHYYATLNYIHYNPVRHRCSKRMDEWEWSSFSWYLEEMGRDWLVEIWEKYPIKNYGDKWDILEARIDVCSVAFRRGSARTKRKNCLKNKMLSSYHTRRLALLRALKALLLGTSTT